ncbi:MAG TPA: Ig-like domain-containing protein [Thermoanaerobaculia bacterium]|nr:Ig-like domain-containing protein [Thermoanaerobaculia bacterium]
MTYVFARYRFLFSFLAIALLALPVIADDVTISGTVTFSSLDGSSLDHDGAVNGIFTVDDGNLTVLGTINCLDTGSGGNSACPMNFAVSGDFTMAPGSAIFAENRTGGGNGADITFAVGGNVSLQSSGPSFTNGAVVSSGNDGNDAAGDITFTVGGSTTFAAGTVVSAASSGGQGGDILVNGDGGISAGGLIASGPTRTVAATRLSGAVVNGGSSNATGGNITLRSTSSSEPAVVIGSLATIVSQGENGGSGLVLVEGCGIEVGGLVASVAKSGTTSAVSVHSGTTLLVSSTGMVRADSLANSAASYKVDLFAANSIQIDGAASPYFSINSNPSGSNGTGGSIRVISLESTVTATGNAFRAGGTANNSNGGSINIAAAADVNLNGATISATGGSSGSGGSIAARSYSGGVSWQAGVGDARPTGSSIAVANRGTIALTYCTTVSTTGSSFPTNGAPVGAYPTTTNACSPAAPSLPVGVTLPDCNEPPVAVDDAYGVAEGGTLNVAAPGVLVNDTDADLDPLTAILVSGPTNAANFTFNADGSFDYEHDGSETLTDSFTYKANDGSADSNIATVTITITPVNDAPVANDDGPYNVNEGGTITFAAPGVLANDTDVDGPGMTAVLVTGPANASVFALNADGSWTYTHDGSETPLTDSFTYQAFDGSALSNVATVTITITPVNDAPVANDDGPYNVNEGGTFNLPAPGVLANDTDAENDGLTAILVTGPANAANFTFNADGSFSYEHDGGETTSDSFTYKANDGSADSNVATVFITITGVNDAPVANDDGPYNVNEGGTFTLPAPGVLANDTDPDGPGMTAVLVTGPANASIFALNADGSFTYTHNGSESPLTDSFTYQVFDGIALSNVATVSITINSVNDTPTANPDSFLGVGNTELRVGTGPAVHPAAVVSGSVLANDVDADGPSPLFVSAFDATSANGGTVTMLPNGTFNFLPAVGYVGSDSFNYLVSDGVSNAIGSVTISIAERVWYVNPTAAGPETGRSTEPFLTIGQAEAASAVNDYIHVAQGAQAGGIVLKDGQRLIGSGVPLVVGPYTLAAATVRPTLGDTVLLADGNLVAGLNITPTGSGISGTNVASGTITEVGITGGTDGVTLTNVTGTFTLTNVSAAPAGPGFTINGGTANVTANNLNVTTTGAIGILANGTGTLAFNGGSVTTTNGTAVNLSNHTLGGSGLISVSATFGVNGIVLSNTLGTLTVTGTGAAGSGGTITGMSGRGVNATNAAGLSLSYMNINNSGLQGVLVTNALAGASSVSIANSSFTGNTSNGVQTANNGTGAMTVTVNANTFTSNTAAVSVQTTNGALTAKVTNNLTTFNSSNAINVTRGGVATGVVEATITGNTIGATGVPNSGATCGGGCSGILVSAGGSNAFRVLVSNNAISQVDADGIRVLGSGSAVVAATITNNNLSDPVADALFGIEVQSGTAAANTTSLCGHIAGNTVTGAWTTDVFVRNFAAGSTFSLPGYAGLGTDTTAVANFLIAQNTITTAQAVRKTTVPANQFSGGAACATPAP